MEPFCTNKELWRCPLCRAALEAGEGCLHCHKGHTFSLSSRGYGDFAPQSKASQYDTPLFEARRRTLEGECYKPLINCLASLIEAYASKGVMLDAGCGEGSFLKALTDNARTAIGVDLSREGIRLAAKGGNPILWCVGDLRVLPVQDRSISCLLNILSPAFYEDFGRVLKNDGVLIKVIPEEGYLQEIRFLAKDQLRHESYSNASVLERFKSCFTLLENRELFDRYSLSPEQANDFVTMTPLAANIDTQKLPIEQLDRISIHLRVLVGRAKKV